MLLMMMMVVVVVGVMMVMILMLLLLMMMIAMMMTAIIFNVLGYPLCYSNVQPATTAGQQQGAVTSVQRVSTASTAPTT